MKRVHDLLNALVLQVSAINQVAPEGCDSPIWRRRPAREHTPHYFSVYSIFKLCPLVTQLFCASNN